MPSVAEIYRLTKKTPDLPWNVYVCRPVAAAVVHVVADSSVTPNQITLAALGVALLSAALLIGLPGYVGLVVAVVLFELSYVLDCADGMLARLRKRASTVGHLFDFLMDEIKAFAILAAAATRLYFEHGRDARYLLVGLFGLVVLASGVALTTFLRRPEVLGPATEAKPTGSPSVLRRAIGAAEGVAKLVIHYPSYILFCALFDRLDLYFFPYVAVNALYALRTLASVTVRFGRS